MQFKVKLITASGEALTKTFSGNSVTDVRNKVLTEEGCFPISIDRDRSALHTKRNIKTSSIIIFNQELLAILKAGIPLLQSLEILSEHGKDPVLRESILQIVSYLKEGASFSEALEQVGVFPQVYLANIVAGERSGTLPEVIDRWLSFQTFAQKNRRSIVEALIYPAFLALVMIIAIVVVVNVVLPRFADIYSDSNIPMPAATKVLLSIGELMRKTVYIQGLTLIGLGFFVRWTLVTAEGRRFLDRFILMLPKFGTLYRMYHSSIFTRTLGVLLAGGMPVVQALDVIQRTSPSANMQVQLVKVAKLVRAGSPLYLALKESQLLHPMAIEMTKVGEQSSALPEMLNCVADFFDQEVVKATTVITTLIGPIMILIMGIVVMGLVTAVYVPLFNASDIAS